MHLRTILYKDKDDVNIYKSVLEWIYQNYLQVCKAEDVEKAEESSEAINKKWLKTTSLLTAAISKVEGGLLTDARRHEIELANIKATVQETIKSDHESNPSVPKIASSLRPDSLDLTMNPVKFNIWIEKFGEFVRGNKISTFSKPDQISYAKTLISDELWTLIKSKVNEKTQAAVFNQGKVTLDRDENGDDGWMHASPYFAFCFASFRLHHMVLLPFCCFLICYLFYSLVCFPCVAWDSDCLSYSF